jgi:hypothetical protein
MPDAYFVYLHNGHGAEVARNCLRHIVLVDDCIIINAEERIQFFGINIMVTVVIVYTEKLIPFSLIYEVL